ncbi:MAG: hypothetical protein Q9183_001119, partial [Haloplaca sp. 2 TL-2023]
MPREIDVTSESQLNPYLLPPKFYFLRCDRAHKHVLKTQDPPFRRNRAVRQGPQAFTPPPHFIGPAQTEFASLSSLADIVTPKSTTPADFLPECRSGAFNGTKAVYRTFHSVSITGRIEGDVVEALAGAGVRFISHCGAGYDQIDVQKCSEFKIHVSNTPTAVDASTADTALFLLLATLRNFPPSLLSLRSHQWRGSPPLRLGHDPEGKTLGIIGMGGIGRNLALKCRALGMKILYHNRSRLSEEVEREARADYRGFEDLLAESDVVSVNCPLNEQTRHLLGEAELKKMKKGGIVINTARGAVINEEALV